MTGVANAKLLPPPNAHCLDDPALIRVPLIAYDLELCSPELSTADALVAHSFAAPVAPVTLVPPTACAFAEKSDVLGMTPFIFVA